MSAEGRAEGRAAGREGRLASSLTLVLALGGATACADGSPVESAARDATVRDSAGVEIVLNLADTAGLPVWRPDSTPLLEVGSVSGNPSAEFAVVADALRLDDGTLVIADGQVMEIRFFGPDGRHMRTVGGRGEGPGEFRTIFHVTSFGGDSIVAWDTFARRATVFSGEGDLIRTVRLEYPAATWPDGSPGPAFGLRPVSPASAGGWISLAVPNAAMPPNLGLPGTYAHPGLVLAHGEEGGIRDTLAEVPGREILYAPTSGGHETVVLAAGGRTHVAIRGEGFAVARADRFEIRVHAGDGTLLRLIRYPRLERRYEDAEFDARRRFVLDRLEEREFDPSAEQALALSVSPAYKPEWRPVLSDLRVDRGGGLWVAEWRGDPEEAARWLVFGPDGRARAVAEVPLDLHPLELGEEGLVAARTDELDVPFVGVWAWRAGR